MENLNIIKMHLQDIKKLSLVKNGDCGKQSKIYRLNEKECIKVFNQSKDFFELKRINNFTMLNYDFINNPNFLVLIKNRFKAYTSNYINGTMLTQMNKNIECSTFFKLSAELINNVMDFSEEKIIIYDCNGDNIMYNYDSNKLNLIDLLEWNYSYKDLNDIKRINFEIIISAVSNFITNDKNQYYLFLKSIDMNSDYIDFFETFKQIMEKENNIKIKTIGDIRNVTRTK